MSTPATTDTEFTAQPARAPAMTQPFYWAVRREIWEHRALYLGPLIVAGVMLLGSLLSGLNLFGGHVQVGLPTQWQTAAAPTALAALYSVVAVVIVFTMVVETWFYCLDALYSERRDRSILFWKSLPVSDSTTVLSKLCIALVVLPAGTFVVTVATHLLLLIFSTIKFAVLGQSPLFLWTQLPLLKMWALLLYALVVMTLWYAPLYGWLLLVSAWARRAAFLWAALPPLAIALAERVAVGTHYFGDMLAHRMSGGFEHGFAARQVVEILRDTSNARSVNMSVIVPDRMEQIFNAAATFFAQPGLWLGLVAGAGFVAAAVWMRRYREPL